MKARIISIFAAVSVIIVITTLLFTGRGMLRSFFHQGYSSDLGGTVPPWTFIWHPAHPISQNVPAQRAFFEGARGVDSSGNEHLIYAAVWLMVGPTHGEAIVQFAKGDSFLAQAALSVNPTTHDWDGGGGDLPPHQPCGKGYIQYTYLGPVCNFGFGQGAKGPFAQWSAPDGNLFLADRLPYQATRPAGATSVLLGKAPGWMTQPGFGYTSVVVPLPNGHTFLLASTAGTTHTLAAAQAIMAHLDSFLPEQ